jgi:16S rRNA (cytosine1402-N4)-methyltransferase
MTESPPIAHRPVLVEEVLEGLRIRPDGLYLDGTLGSAGHSAAILARLGPAGRLLALDRDPDAIARAGRRLGPDPRLRIRHTCFSRMAEVAAEEGWGPFDGILLDFGVSSDQLETPSRGFSFQAEGPLDMRMSGAEGVSAADWLAAVGEAELVQTLRVYGEEPDARRIARAVTSARARSPLATTLQLAELADRVKGGRRGARIHPATRVFQAVRMAVNAEEAELKQGLQAALRLLRPGGRLAAIGFHSVENRWIKHILNAHVGRMESLPQGGERWVGEHPRARRVTRKAVRAGEAERAENPRARSAELRVVEILEETT